MELNNCCYKPIQRDDCCCKDGIICALDWFYQSMLSMGASWIQPGSLSYYPNLIGTSGNTIYGIPYITPDIVPIYIDSSDPQTSNIAYLNICKLHGFEFILTDASKESEIVTRFSKICYTSPKLGCCKSGVLEYLLKSKQFLIDNKSTNSKVIISTSSESFEVNFIIAVNKDTIWAKYSTSSSIANTKYYVVSICEIIGITTIKKTS